MRVATVDNSQTGVKTTIVKPNPDGSVSINHLEGDWARPTGTGHWGSTATSELAQSVVKESGGFSLGPGEILIGTVVIGGGTAAVLAATSDDDD